MFGSKLRSWMENHIVRPRKKGNKNKNGSGNGSSNSNFGILTATNGHPKVGGSSTGVEGNATIGSPARRCEVSPIQYHTASRRGWQSPSQDHAPPLSPKSDDYRHYQLQNHCIRSPPPSLHHFAATNSGPSSVGSVPIYGNGTLPTSSSSTAAGVPHPHKSGNHYGNGRVIAPADHHQQQYHQHQQQHQQQQHLYGISSPRSISRHEFDTLDSSSLNGANYSKSVDCSYSGERMYSLKEDCYRKSSSSGGAGGVPGHDNGVMANNSLHYSTATSSSNELLEDLRHFEQEGRIRQNGQHIKISSSSSSSINSNNNLVNNNNIMGGGYMNGNGYEAQQRAICESKYGKLQTGGAGKQQISQQFESVAYYERHNSINNNLMFGVNQKLPPQPGQLSPALGEGASSIKEAKGKRHQNNNNNNNNGYEICPINTGHGHGSCTKSGSSNQQQPTSALSSFANKFHKLTGGSRSSSDATNSNNGSSKLNHVNNNNSNGHNNNAGAPSATLQQPHQQPKFGTQQQQQQHLHHHHGHSHTSHHLAPTTQTQSGPNGAGGANGHHNTLSSPESAYSTGYSTDGTSPGGCSYTPEYYINIRTGTHYFPKGLTSAAGGGGSGAGSGCIGSGAGGPENGNKFKCGLNRIEERHVEFAVEEKPCASPRRCSGESFSEIGPTTRGPISSSAKSSLSSSSALKNSGSCSSNNNNNNSCTAVCNGGLSQQHHQQQHLQQQHPSSAGVTNAVAMSPVMQKNLGMQHYRSIESPSPRQRCRIRTNPWLTTLDGSMTNGSTHKSKDQDSGSTSSGIKSSSGTDDNKKDSKKLNALSDSDSSSSTEKVVSKKLLTPRGSKKMIGLSDVSRLDSKATTFCSNLDSDEDATLNEMMGKFDESYHYEKETDILSCSDSDPTDCPSDIDTGQDAGDECDTDDLLDLDFIDTGSVQEVIDKENYKHTGSCSYHNFPERRSSSRHKSRSKRNSESGGSKRRKKLVRTRKKTADGGNGMSASGSLSISRGCRSLGGTPMTSRRNQSEERTPTNSSPLGNRCNSLTFTELHSLQSRYLAISESEKALLKADLEADVKYKQLIHEAESILFSMKTNSTKELRDVKEPPAAICSPRRICNPPANKRVEMLRNCEADLKRELAKTCSQKCSENGIDLNPIEGVIVNKRLEVIRYETSISAPNSPKNTRVIPRKTHVTNFISQNHCPEIGKRQCDHENDLKSAKTSSQSVAYDRNIVPPRSPVIVRRRFRSQSPKQDLVSDSDSDDLSRNLDKNHCKNKSNKENVSNRKSITGKQLNNFRHTIHAPSGTNSGVDDPRAVVYSGSLNESELKQRSMHKSPLMSFRSVDIGNKLTEDSYCPQSEPLKRKIYTCSSTFEKIQRSLDADPELSKKALLHRISLLRRERQAKSKLESSCSVDNSGHEPAVAAGRTQTPLADRGSSEQIQQTLAANGSLDAETAKQRLIMSTLADIKRSLEDQSVELNELNDSDN
ncbi:uncharacterized protein DDB_G0283357 [Uranotaenia lowii]|uniref:uncharacterized protein DDB_G0283357 n=1 Tax=Uranotaenia lowii TaxID=190385 RepID=UPI00247A90E6|nr:uncharacterized protein DDB_G0283357 [Uranotaenia lowii]XP_055602698.1 uncharacterized protein DDB_G0283357 [Uranotaenia lowii]XP_055602699.1 uncharacterized protein DDB_G0283357 [Uranotaenia lowii]